MSVHRSDTNTLPPAQIGVLEVVGFHGACHAILGWLCYATFMVIPNYTHLSLKMLGPRGLITARQRAASSPLSPWPQTGELATIRAQTAKEAPNSNRNAGLFELAEGVKEMQRDPNNEKRKVARIGTSLFCK